MKNSSDECYVKTAGSFELVSNKNNFYKHISAKLNEKDVIWDVDLNSKLKDKLWPDLICILDCWTFAVTYSRNLRSSAITQGHCERVDIMRLTTPFGERAHIKVSVSMPLLHYQNKLICINVCTIFCFYFCLLLPFMLLFFSCPNTISHVRHAKYFLHTSVLCAFVSMYMSIWVYNTNHSIPTQRKLPL